MGRVNTSGYKMWVGLVSVNTSGYKMWVGLVLTLVDIKCGSG